MTDADEDGGPAAEEADFSPRCPFCGDDDGACEHAFGSVVAGDELLAIVPEWSEIDDLVSDLQRLTREGDEILEATSLRPEGWWLKSRGRGFGVSRRLAGADVVAERLHLAAVPHESGAVAYFSEDAAGAREKLRGALDRVKRSLTAIARRLGVG